MQRKTLLMILLAAAALVPLAASQTDVTAVVGTTTDIDVGEADPDLAALAGHAEYQVTWFDSSVLYSRDLPTSKDICAVPDAQATPVGQTLTATGTTYTYTDPNSNAWTTTKYTYSGSLEAYCVDVAASATDATIGTYNFVLMTDTADLGGTALDLYVV